MHIGPTAFGQNPAPGVPAIVLLPYCDGDVSDLQGQGYVDAARDTGSDPALRSAVLVFGANHNFFNAEWTPGSPLRPPWTTGATTPTTSVAPRGDPRLTPAAQRKVGTTYTAAAAAVFVAGDPEALPLLDGARRGPPRPGRRGCSRAPSVSADLLPLPSSSTPVPTAVRSPPGPAGPRRPPTSAAVHPRRGVRLHPTLPPAVLRGRRAQPAGDRRVLDRRRAGRASTSRPPARWPAAASLDLRIAVPAVPPRPRSPRLTDTAGHQLTLPDTSLTGLPADPSAFSGKTWAQDVRLPLKRAHAGQRIDLAAIARVESLPRSGDGPDLRPRRLGAQGRSQHGRAAATVRAWTSAR